MQPNERTALLEQVRLLARRAGQAIMPFYRQGLVPTAKPDSSPLTSADLASHSLIAAALPAFLPGLPVISEESEPALRDSLAGAERFWLVDPLDGTKEFLKGAGEFTVNIALVENGRCTLGVVDAPALDASYCAAAGLGAWRRRGIAAPEPIAARPAPPAAQLALVASKDHAGPRVQALLAKLPGATLRSMGSSLKFCLVAEGSADLYLRDLPTMEWDTAAAQCVVETAGGQICSLDGERLLYGKPGLKNPPIMTVGDPSLDWKQLAAVA